MMNLWKTNSNITSDVDYILLQDQRFGNNTGSSLWETTVIIQLPIIFNCATVLLLSKFGAYSKSSFSSWLFLLEFIGTIFPLILFLTVLSDYIYGFFIFVLLITLPISLYKSVKLDLRSNWKPILKRSFLTSDKLPCISQFRGVVNMFSVVCILTADFTCFPRRFLKTEFYGFSLMDSGVGLFVVAYSLSCTHFRTRRLHFFSASFSIFRKVLPLLLIGIGRYLTTVSIKYQHRLSEYGIHWNFFITLSVLILFNEILFLFIRSVKNTFLFSIIILCSYELSLSIGLKDWIFGNSPRLSFVSANREGICSLVGYEILYLWGAIIRSFLPKKGDSFQKYRDSIPLYTRYAITCLILTIASQNFLDVSRRCANCGYVFWITGVSMMGLIYLILFEILVHVLNSKIKTRIVVTVPRIIEAINFNGFVFFLLGNVLTGIINLSLRTLMLSNTTAVLIIVLYIACCCSVTTFLYLKNWRLR